MPTLLRPVDGDLAMDVEELLSYLRNMEYEQFSPLAGVLAQTEAIGDPALPTKEHTAILNWLGTAIQDWEQNFPLEEPLAAGLRRIKPLLAALAVSEPGFMTPEHIRCISCSIQSNCTQSAGSHAWADWGRHWKSRSMSG